MKVIRAQRLEKCEDNLNQGTGRKISSYTMQFPWVFLHKEPIQRSKSQFSAEQCVFCVTDTALPRVMPASEMVQCRKKTQYHFQESDTHCLCHPENVQRPQIYLKTGQTDWLTSDKSNYFYFFKFLGRDTTLRSNSGLSQQWQVTLV